jgi:hypothetical protein
MNIQDGMLTTHSERTYLAPEADLLREYLGAPDEIIDCPTPAQRELFGPKRRRVPEMMDLKNPILLGPVQNQEHHMNGVVARRNNFNEPILNFLINALRRVRPAHRPLLRPDHEYKTRMRIRSSSRSVAPPKISRRLAIICATSATPRWLDSRQCHSPLPRSRDH